MIAFLLLAVMSEYDHLLAPEWEERVEIKGPPPPTPETQEKQMNSGHGGILAQESPGYLEVSASL